MSEVKRYRFISSNGYAAVPVVDSVKAERFVEEQEFDRVTAERDAALGREAECQRQLGDRWKDIDALKTSLEAVTFNLDKTDKVALALQQRLTAADERADVLEGLLREVQKSARKQDWASGYPTLFASVYAALKPAEAGADSCEFCKGWGFRANPDGADEGCGACAGTGKESSDDQL